MGGSSGTIPIGGNGGVSSAQGCPRKFEAILVDVLQTGNSDYAMNIADGDELELAVSSDGSAVALSHKGKIIGFLPPQRANVVECINQGWKYSASLVGKSEDLRNPQIKVLVIGVPN